MRRLLASLFRNSKNVTKKDVPSLPSNLSYSELNFYTKRGYLAKKIGQYLEMTEQEADQLFYISLGKQSFLNANKNDRIEHILFLSEQLLIWSEQHLDIEQEMETLELSNDLQNILLKVYQIHKQDVFYTTPSIKEVNTNYTTLEKNEDSKWEVYRDVMFAATQGQFLLISEEEVSQYLVGHVFCQGEIKERSDIPFYRNKAKEGLENLGFHSSKIMGWILVLSEAITNIIKHAEHGKMTLIESKEENEIRFVIEDSGPGFPLKELPNNTLLAGYSTKKSMGQGFTLMMKMTKQILLHTSIKGSTIILVFDTSKEKEGNFNATNS